VEIPPGKASNLHRTPTASTQRPLDDNGLRHNRPARPDRPALYAQPTDAIKAPMRHVFLGSRFRLRLPSHPASRRRSCPWLVVGVISSTGDLHPRAAGHAGRTGWRSPAVAGLLCSRPVSRILSRAVIHLSGLPGPWRAACERSCSALHQVGFTWPPRHRDAGALLPHHFTLTGSRRCSGPELRRCHFCGTFPRVSPGRRYRPPSPAMSGLSSKGLPPRLLSLRFSG